MKLKNFREHLITNFILIIYFAIVVFAAVMGPLLYSRWVNSPFIGGFIDPTMHFKQFSKVIAGEIWPANDRQWGQDMELIALDKVKVTSVQEVQEHLADLNPGDTVVVSIRTKNGAVVTAPIALTTFSSFDRLFYFFLPYFCGWLSLLSSLWLLSDQRRHPLTLAYTILAASIALIFFTWFDYYTTHEMSILFFVGIAIAASALIQIAILLPRKKRLIKNSIWVNLIAYPVNLLLVGLGMFQINQPDLNLLPLSPLILLMISFGISVFVLTFSILILRTETLSPFLERHTQAVLGATILSLLPYAIQLVVSLFNGIEPLANPSVLYSLCLLPITLAVLQKPYSLPRAKGLKHHMPIYLFLAFMLGVSYSLIISIINLFLATPISTENPLILGSLIFLTILIFAPARKRVAEILDLPTLPITEPNVDLALEYTEKLSAADNPESATRILYDALIEVIHPTQLYIFLYDPEVPGYVAADPDHHRDKRLVLPSESDLAATLKKTHNSLYIQDKGLVQKDFVQDREVLGQMDARLHVPILGSYGLLGWVSLGDKLKDRPYEARELKLIESLATQFALIYERSDTIHAITHRLKEMEVLNQIAISINRINDIDPLLMAIFDHLRNLLRIDQLSLVMKTEDEGHFQRQFLCREHHIIISSQAPENLEGDFPEKQALTSGKSIFQEQGNDTRLIVPLETDDGITGALSLISSDGKTIFHHTDLNLIDSIASLTAGAIIKTRLLQASQAQAQHLSLLHQVSRQLTSTLVMEQLLTTIVESAATILNSASGLLMILDETTDDLVIKVTAGQVNSGIKGKQLSKDQGVAGEAYRTKKPVILNNRASAPTSSSLFSQITELEVENILVTPLISQDEVIGLLEIINKNNELPFTEKDQEVLGGFASQAAVALNNARLYTKTDQALEKRIEELSVMQQIDRDLHSSQSLDDALQTTLKAALSQTQALCGTIAMVDTYSHEIENIWQMIPGQDQPIPLEKMDLRDFIWFSEESTAPYQIIDSSVSELSEMLKLSMECKTHFLIQADLGDNQYALLILHLESADKLSDGDIDFLIRLTDHAVIALRNALLYEDLQDAVQSKNEFISFISHELKNPLTAIKGHADILAKGMVGEINEEQEDFLRTISHNVRRMSTFITDLSDQSHIESKSLRMAFAATPVDEVVNEVLQSYAQQIKEKSIKIDYKINAGLPEVWCDRLRLIQVLSNLLSNAVKYTPADGNIEIAAEYAINNWDQEGAAEVVHFWVKDDGYGIAPEDQEHIFEKFYRGTNETILRIPGTGLGLRISKSMVEMMGGTMWFESAPGEGSTFHFTIPI